MGFMARARLSPVPFALVRWLSPKLRDGVCSISQNFNIPILLLLLIFYYNSEFFRFAESGKRRIHISDDLEDVVDEEEDETWKQWGKSSTPSSDELDPSPSDLNKMDMWQIQELMMKQQFGPVFGFVKLRLGVHRTPDIVTEFAMKWTKVLRTGAIGVKFTGVDASTIMFVMEKGRHRGVMFRT